ncbi:DNA-directed RNA polymerase III subunit RPC4 isoform X2 [Corythoichthys intestinalis]|nr:DNA-directed RNA polymerase III subunit RPC4 isoform X2 [Corythoichthys intestinalis]XP_057688219.1 DNA-directed RNA polymerase III subunit RPC4 isoform X2 [Corythoichthys intestinalis]XP_061804248.1 DNA-directed RNA polymerase III subunit RPC4-like [Nerophis lumbriciformis]
MADSGTGDSSGHHMPPPGRGGRGQLMGRRTPATISAGRLPAMRSRDLTLGGVKKKTFTPNIIGRKVREDAKDDGGQRRERKDTPRGRGPRERGRGRGRGYPETIQSHSIFEQGPAELSIRKKGYESERDAPSTGPSPIINIKKENRETEEETKAIIRKLEQDSFIDDPFLKSEQRSCPVQLPLAVSGWGFQQEFSAPKIKIEKMDEDDPMEPALEIKEEDAEIKKTESTFKPPPLPEPDVLPDLLHRWSLSKGEELFFMQLPDTLPGQPPTKEYKPIKTEVQSEDGQSVLLKTESQEEKNEDDSCHLKDLREGYVGKMLVRKSGRVQLIMGQVTLDVSLGASCSFLQELVSVDTEGRTGDLTVLGNVKHKMVCSPDFESLLESR